MQILIFQYFLFSTAVNSNFVIQVVILKIVYSKLNSAMRSWKLVIIKLEINGRTQYKIPKSL